MYNRKGILIAILGAILCFSFNAQAAEKVDSPSDGGGGGKQCSVTPKICLEARKLKSNLEFEGSKLNRKLVIADRRYKKAEVKGNANAMCALQWEKDKIQAALDSGKKVHDSALGVLALCVKLVPVLPSVPPEPIHTPNPVQ